MTDLFGAPLVYSPQDGLTNQLGVVASSSSSQAAAAHTALCSRMRAERSALKLLSPWSGPSPQNGPPPPVASDVARSVGGMPLSTGWIDEAVSRGVKEEGEKKPSLLGYIADEGSAFRGMMSHTCRLVLNWEGGEADGLPRSVYWKRVMITMTMTIMTTMIKNNQMVIVKIEIRNTRNCSVLHNDGHHGF